MKRKAFFNRQKALRVLFAQYLYAAEAADGDYYGKIIYNFILLDMIRQVSMLEYNYGRKSTGKGNFGRYISVSGKWWTRKFIKGIKNLFV